jgi:hypothetical protein
MIIEISKSNKLNECNYKFKIFKMLKELEWFINIIINININNFYNELC